MGLINVDEENSSPIDLHFEDHGEGPTIVLVHGWPLSSASWEKQTAALLEAGYRVISYDRRGFGQSDKPSTGYDYDTMASDLDILLTELDLSDVTLVGFSMGGGELARYVANEGTDRVAKLVFISSIAPFLLKTDDNPEGVDRSVFSGMEKAIREDRPDFLRGFLKSFYNFEELGGSTISQAVLDANWSVAVQASPKATLDCVGAWLEDFREDVAAIDVPTLIIHGTRDQIVPIEASGGRMPDLIDGAELVRIEDGPHGILWTHADQVNTALLKFLAD
ncbi:MAG: alpha/beta hydrolase [Alphaproteobacteria bacterium]|nr:MAG: alpha/beta hydrolase [Alphaproteobacteria bacterium]PZO37446.1 MAG: alpha/beta hydrolase [Alphaproteobacteria bacterium]